MGAGCGGVGGGGVAGEDHVRPIRMLDYFSPHIRIYERKNHLIHVYT